MSEVLGNRHGFVFYLSFLLNVVYHVCICICVIVMVLLVPPGNEKKIKKRATLDMYIYYV